MSAWSTCTLAFHIRHIAASSFLFVERGATYKSRHCGTHCLTRSTFTQKHQAGLLAAGARRACRAAAVPRAARLPVESRDGQSLCLPHLAVSFPFRDNTRRVRAFSCTAQLVRPHLVVLAWYTRREPCLWCISALASIGHRRLRVPAVVTLVVVGAPSVLNVFLLTLVLFCATP